MNLITVCEFYLPGFAASNDVVVGGGSILGAWGCPPKIFAKKKLDYLSL